MTYEELYPLFANAASQGGFGHFFGRSGTPSIEQIISEYHKGARGLPSARWTEDPNQSSDYVRWLNFWFKSDNFRDEPDHTKRVASSVVVILKRENTDSFTQKEWEIFFRYYREILPSIFEDKAVRLEISRHPALFTDSLLLLEVLASMDYEIPERYLEKAREEQRFLHAQN